MSVNPASEVSRAQVSIISIVKHLRERNSLAQNHSKEVYWGDRKPRSLTPFHDTHSRNKKGQLEVCPVVSGLCVSSVHSSYKLSNTFFALDPLLGLGLPSGLPLSSGGLHLLKKAGTSQGNQEHRDLGTREEGTGPTQGEGSNKAPEKGQHLSWPWTMSRRGAYKNPAGKEAEDRGPDSCANFTLGIDMNSRRLAYQVGQEICRGMSLECLAKNFGLLS